MRAVDIITKKRSNKEVSKEELDFLIKGYLEGTVPEYQVSAFLMAVFFNGMTSEETANLTKLMVHSGKVLSFSDPSPYVDKHSTGGVGDKISLIIAPMVAACGIKVPMMSGRALGHTGGTLDKLDSIPGYRTNLTEAEFRAIIDDVGFAMMGQTAEIAPADKRLYALRDVTATVESIPLITASILSKKVAEGAQALVIDVKAGSGAFMKNKHDAQALACSLIGTGAAMGKMIIAVITSMDEPLGNKIGNFFEIEETLDCLEGKGPADIMELSLRLGAWMLVAGRMCTSIEEAEGMCKRALSTGKALERFRKNVQLQGGDLKIMEKMRDTCRSSYFYEVRAPQSGYIAAIDSFELGAAGVYLGVGRNTTSDRVYPDVGFILSRRRGDKVSKDELVCKVYGKDEASCEASRQMVGKAFHWSETPPAVPYKLILEELGRP